ncbi:nucleotidyl transferase AbiEii/AbiGii toxin family protein [Actinomadura sp. WAC 06369]|uniref:nucleotidyl transferase AbiEii/AbiGii toxin family protein n=1 Tax=Actinomadura sp. WAC 06369 TaxID=2203193 RepID=UPI001315A079|nr:nucleotidyl transferase AbiEii/AbiGii toxin family protein [Actinomadura sp. WAC 06369]
MSGYRAAPSYDEPVFGTPQERADWRAARWEALGHVLSAVSESPWADDLVLRGSVLLRAWYGDAARDPGDVDFVVLPSDLHARDWWSRGVLDGVERLVTYRTGYEEIEVDGTAAERSELWPYSDSPGVRLSMRWRSDAGPRGRIQADFSFGEPLPAEPDLVLVPVPGGVDGPHEVPLRCAAPGLSLAWKVRWLLADSVPQPKDLYDAWLLAGDARLDTGLVDGLEHFDPEQIKLLRIDARRFADACPQADGPPERYVRELAERLA